MVPLPSGRLAAAEPSFWALAAGSTQLSASPQSQGDPGRRRALAEYRAEMAVIVRIVIRPTEMSVGDEAGRAGWEPHKGRGRSTRAAAAWTRALTDPGFVGRAPGRFPGETALNTGSQPSAIPATSSQLAAQSTASQPSRLGATTKIQHRQVGPHDRQGSCEACRPDEREVAMPSTAVRKAVEP